MALIIVPATKPRVRCGELANRNLQPRVILLAKMTIKALSLKSPYKLSELLVAVISGLETVLAGAKISRERNPPPHNIPERPNFRTCPFPTLNGLR
jgi:hypothetical protein